MPGNTTFRSGRRRRTPACTPASARPARGAAGIRPRSSTARRSPSVWAATTPRWPGGPRRSATTSPACLRRQGVAGTPAQVVDQLGRYAEAGAERAYLQVLDLADLDHLDLIAAEVVPQLR